MIGSRGPRMLAAALPYVEMWNGWYEDWDNNRAGLARLLAEIDAACEKANRDPGTLIRTICPLVRMPGGRGRISLYQVTTMSTASSPRCRMQAFP